MNEVAKVYKESKELQYLCKLQKNQIDYSRPEYKNYVYVNCWIWEDGCTLTATENGKRLKVEKSADSDPLAAKVIFAKPNIFETKKESKKTNRLSRAANMFRFKASSATTPVVITLTTPDGESYTQTFNRPTPLPVE